MLGRKTMSDKKSFGGGIALGVSVLLLLGSILAWVMRVENRLGQFEQHREIRERVANLETLLVPVIVEYNVRLRLGVSPLAKPDWEATLGPAPLPAPPPGEEPLPEPAPAPPAPVSLDEIIEQEQFNAEEQVQKRWKE
jgi:hypothetical protein